MAVVRWSQSKRESEGRFRAKTRPERTDSSAGRRKCRIARRGLQTPGETQKRPRLRALRNVERWFHLGTMVEETRSETDTLDQRTRSGVSILGTIAYEVAVAQRLFGWWQLSSPCLFPAVVSRARRAHTRWKAGIPGPRNTQRVYVVLPACAGLARCCAGRRWCMPLPR
jgi:hypothetical protein